MARHDLTIRYQTMITQRLPEAYKEKLVSFQKYVLKLRKQHKYLLGQVWNADQTPVLFDMQEYRTVNSARGQAVQITTMKAEKQSCTVMLAITANGQKLPHTI
jgi:hypothetical protein